MEVIMSKSIQIYTFMIIFSIGFLGILQGVSGDKSLYQKDRVLEKVDKKRGIERRFLRSHSKMQFISNGSVFFTSDQKSILGHFVLMNADAKNSRITGAKVYLNGTVLNEMEEKGAYKGFAPLKQNANGKSQIDLKIETRDRRMLTASEEIPVLLKMRISNLFPNQADKIDVGTAVKINWDFIPNTMNYPVDLEIVNHKNSNRIYTKKNMKKGKIVISEGSLPKRKKIRVKINIPIFELKYKTPTHKDSWLKIHVKDEVVLNTFG